MAFFGCSKHCFRFFFFLLFLYLSSSLQAGLSDTLNAVNLGKINVTDGGLIEGEHIDLRTATFYWETTDIVVPGNGKLDIRIGRSFNKTAFASFLELENWQIEVPRIIHAMAGKPIAAGELYRWQGGLCGEPRGENPNLWSGLQLVIPGDPPRELFFRDPSAKQFPESVKYVTHDNWIVECRTSEQLKTFFQNSKDAELKARHQNDTDIFLVTAPDGRRFWFDTIERQHGIDWGNTYGYYSPAWIISRPSRVEDIHGNWLEYRYMLVSVPSMEGIYKDALIRLKKITASDGRSVELFYDPLGRFLQKITANEKIWQYQYIRGQLAKVIRPDGTAWQYQYNGPNLISYGNYLLYKQLTRVETPNGATIDYATQSIPAGQFIGVDSPFQISALSTRTVKGPGLKEATWKYSFSSRDSISVTNIAAPAHREVHEFHRSGDWRIGLPYSRSIYHKGDSKPLRQEVYEWDKSAAFGNSKVSRERFIFLSEGTQKHLVKKALDGKYTTQHQDHDIYGNPQKIIETGTDAKITQRSYLNKTDANLWRIGLPKDEHIENGASILREYNEKGDLTKLTEYGITTTFDYHPTGDLKSKTQQAQTTYFDNYTHSV